MGRPKKKRKEINPVRQVGRWPNNEWNRIKRAAHKQGKSIREAIRPELLAWAERILNE